MILVLGGTTEGRIAVQTLEEAGKPFYYSTKGNEQEVPLHNGIRLQGGMDKDSLESFCRKENISLLIDAAHPFAEELHRNVSETADILQIPVIRYERIYPRIENNEGIVWCDNYEDAIRQIKKEEVYIILALTGVNSISKLKALWMESSRCYFRILDRESSRESGIPRRIFTLLPYRRRRTPIDAANTPRSCHPQRERCFRRIFRKTKSSSGTGHSHLCNKAPAASPQLFVRKREIRPA